MTEQIPSFEDAYAAFKTAASISMDTKEAAKKYWEKQRTSYVKGSEDSVSKMKDKRLRHQLLLRLQDELDNLDGSYDPQTQTVGKENIIYAIDQVLIQSYARYEDNRVYDSFSFFNDEFDESNEQDRKQRRAYMLSLYSTIFRTGDFALVRADRNMLLDTIVHFRNQFSKNNEGDLERRISQLEVVCQSLKEGLQQWKTSDPDHMLDYAFDRLIDSESFSEVYEYMIPARINDASHMGKWHSLFSALQKKRSEMLDACGDEEEKRNLETRWKLFARILKTAENDGVFSSNLRHDLEISVSLFNTYSALERDEDGKPISLLKPGQVSKLVELAMEIHVCNAALDSCGIECQVKYISPSRYLYDFKRGMSQGISLPLVHPRTFKAYSDEKQYKVIKRITRAAFTRKSGFAGIAQRNDDVTTEELEAIETAAAKTKLRAFRTYAAYGANTKAVLSGFASSVDRAAKDLLQRSGCDLENSKTNRKICQRVYQICSVADELSKFFEPGAQETQGAMGSFADLQTRVFDEAESSASTDDDPYNTFLTLLNAPDHWNSSPRIAVRIVEDRDAKVVKRLVCLPVTGSYRYNFSIPNVAGILNCLKATQDDSGTLLGPHFKSISVNRLLQIIISCAARHPGRSNALLNFVKAVHAASYREWKLADHLCEEGLGFYQDHPEALEECSRDEAVAEHMLQGELLYLKHLALRGLADKVWRGRRKLRSLNIAASYLKKSAHFFDLAYEGTTERSGTMTFRLPMSFAAMAFEVMVLKKELGPTILRVTETDLTSNALFSSVYFDCVELTEIGLRDAWTNPERCLSAVRGCLYALRKAAAENIAHAKADGDPDVLDVTLWSFRLMRVQSMKALFIMAAEIEIIPSDPSAQQKSSDLCRDLDRSLDIYEDFLDGLQLAEVSVDPELVSIPSSASPFSRILWAALEAIEEDSPYVSISNYFFILDNENRLDPAGLPSRVSRLLRKNLAYRDIKSSGENMIDVLTSETQRMKELSELRDSDR